MRKVKKPLLIVTLLALSSLALGACALQLPDGTGQEWWLQDIDNPGRYN